MVQIDGSSSGEGRRGRGVTAVTNVLLSTIPNAYVCLGVGAVGGGGL